MENSICDDAIYELLVEAQKPKECDPKLFYYYWNHTWLGFDESGELKHERRANPEISRLSGLAQLGGERIEVVIYRLENEEFWHLDLVMPNGLSMTWQEKFESDKQALELLMKTARKIDAEISM